MYGFCDGNANAARREYAARLLTLLEDYQIKKIFSLTFQRFKRTGSVNVESRAEGVFAPLRNEFI